MSSDGLLEALKLIAICQLGTVAVIGVTIYAVVKVLTTGRSAFFERRPHVSHVEPVEFHR